MSRKKSKHIPDASESGWIISIAGVDFVFESTQWVFSGIAAFLLGVLAATVVHNLAVRDEDGKDYRPTAVEEAVLRG